MAFTVLRVPAVRRIVEQEMTKREQRSYAVAVEALKGEGCRAGGKRLAAIEGGHYPICQRSLYGAWRMLTVYRRNDAILIIGVQRHTEAENPAETLGEAFPGLSPTGRRRSEQPPCCDATGAPPILSVELEARVIDLFGV